ncbi:MAG: OmpA family protein [Pyrinomonadaceae bacterium]|nr:OmpA family protein [Pyrinomonadaceae bacterium]
MAIFDSLLNDVDKQFGLENKAPSLLSELLALITNETRGGFAGFIDAFRRIGMGNVADSWVGSGSSTSISSQQTEDALGSDTMSSIANRVGVPVATTTSALSYMIPQVVDGLTPNGVIPESRDILSRVGTYLTGANAVKIPKRDDTIVVDNRHGEADDVESEGGSILRWLLPLLILGLLLLVGYYACRKPNEEVKTAVVTTKNTATNTNTGEPKTLAKLDSRVSIKAENGKYFLTGIVHDEATKNQMTEAAKKDFGEANVDASGLKVDANASQITWLSKFTELLPTLKDMKNGTLTFVGENTLQAIGDIPQTVIDKSKSLLTGFTLPAIFAGSAAEVEKAANEQAQKALESAKTPEEIVNALNLSIINFASGKSDIPPVNEEILKRAALLLKNVAPGTSIEVGGHTDKQGNAASNQTLSESRANAVKNELVKLGVNTNVLSAKGYGDTRPKASNETEQGRSQNRRIEYTLTTSGGATTSTANSNVSVAK